MAHALPPPDASERERSARVVDALRAAADPSGFLPFDRFMEIALYADDIGFYHRTRPPLGPSGDFYTAAHVHPLFGQTLAARLREIRRAVGGSHPFRIVELGPGDGTLAASVVTELRDEAPGLEYVLVERSPARAREAQERVRRAAPGIPVRVAESVGALGPLAGAVIANEFLDAQPARRLRWDGTSWHELGVRVEGAGMAAAEVPLARAVPGTPLPVPSEAGGVFEVSPAAEGFVREVGDHLVAGAAIVLDYGCEESELLRGHPRGTLAAVRGHRFVADPLDAPGTADLSTFVNFTRIRGVARASGLEEIAFRSQAEALGAWGFPSRLDAAIRTAGSAEAEVRLRLAAKNLLFGFDRFRVLELAPPKTAAVRASAT
ncbi:MAG: SAM-dependent methyltransferase [Thermoplasmata archaeon]